MVRSINRWCVLGMMLCAAPVSLASGQASLRHNLTPVAFNASLTQGELHGTIRDDRGQPLNGVMVSALGSTLMFDISDGEGRYAFRALPPGGYLVRAHLEGYVPPRGHFVQVNAGSRQNWAISMNRAPASTNRAPASMNRAPASMNRAPVESVPTAPLVLTAGAGASDTERPRTEDQDSSELAYRLRRIPRGVLKESQFGVLDAEAPEPLLPSVGRAIGSPARLASSFFDLALSGQVKLLTTTSFDRPQDLFSMTGGAPRPIAYMSLLAPTGDGDWTVRGAMTQGDIASWILAGSYARRATATHRYEAGVSYATQQYQGGNAEALSAMADGSRNVGELYAYDTWTISPQWTVNGGGKTATYAYLDDRLLISGRMGVAFRPSMSRTLTLRLSAAHREIAPGAEEFVPPSMGLWLPPERTFSALSRGLLRPERINHVEIGADHEVRGSFIISLRAFRQEVDDQLVTLFGIATTEVPATLGHYLMATGGDFENYGWGVGVSREVGAFRTSVDYTMFDTERRGLDADEGALERLSPALLRRAERIHDLTATVNSRFAPSATRFMVVYKLNTAYADARTLTPLTDARFEVQVNQEMPFLDFTGARWEMLVGVRNLFRSELFDGSVYDELMVVSPPKRVMGGVTVRF